MCTNPVKLEVKSARVAHRIAAGVAPPQRCVGGGAVAAAGARSPRCRLKRLNVNDVFYMLQKSTKFKK